MKKDKNTKWISFLLLVSLLGTLLLPISALAEGGSTPPSATPQAGDTQSPTDLPATGASAILDAMHVSAASAILVDMDNNEILYAQDAHKKSYPASITKVMTSMITIEAIDRGELSLDQVVTVGPEYNAGIGEGGSTQGIKEGEQLTLRDLLNCALIPSANEACNAMAQVVSGSVPAFVELMNQRAQELGMKDTHFSNTHGYHDDNHYTTAYDVYLMCAEAMKHETFRNIVSSKSYTVPATNLNPQRTLHDTNALVSTFRVRGYYYEYATGIKTGYTPEAGYCLASSATKDGKSLIAVVMGGKYIKDTAGPIEDNYFSESKRLLDWGFSNFSRQTIIDSVKPLREVSVTLSKEADYVAIYPDGSIEATLPNDIDITKFKRDVTCVDPVEAPVKDGQVLGSVTISYDGQEYGTLNLVARNDVDRSELLYRLDRIQKFFDQLWVRILLVALLVLILALVLRFMVFGRRRRKYGARKGGGGRRNYSGRRRR